MQYLSYRNLGEKGGPEFTKDEVKAIASSFEVTDGPNSDGEMFTRPGRPSDRFVSPYLNMKASMAVMEERTHQICLFLSKPDLEEQIIFILF